MSFIKLTNQEKIKILVNNVEHSVSSNQSVAAALLELGISHSGNAMREDRKIGPFCMMGVCHACKISVAGDQNQRACMIPIKAGMKISTGDYNGTV